MVPLDTPEEKADFLYDFFATHRGCCDPDMQGSRCVAFQRPSAPSPAPRLSDPISVKRLTALTATPTHRTQHRSGLRTPPGAPYDTCFSLRASLLSRALPWRSSG